MDYDYDPGGILQGPQITGESGELSVVIDTFFQSREGRKALFTRVVISGEMLPESLDSFQKSKSGDPPGQKVARVGDTPIRSRAHQAHWGNRCE